jgi:hypothetical protein
MYAHVPVRGRSAVDFARSMVAGGGLISYGPDWVDHIGARLGMLIASSRASPADLSVQVPVKVETVINLKTAKELAMGGRTDVARIGQNRRG